MPRFRFVRYIIIYDRQLWVLRETASVDNIVGYLDVTRMDAVVGTGIAK